MHFFYRIQGTKRAQDLNRFKSKTETIVDIPVEPLGFYKGNVSVIFVFYTISILICAGVFTCERLWGTSRNSTFEVVVVDYYRPTI